MNILVALANTAPVFAVVGFIAVATLLILTGWIVVAELIERGRKRWNRWRVPQISAPAALPKLPRRVPGIHRPWLPPNQDHARVEALLRKAGDEIDRRLDAHFEPTAEQDARLIAEAIRICRDAANR